MMGDAFEDRDNYICEVRELKKLIVELNQRISRLRSECRSWRGGNVKDIAQSVSLCDKHNDVTSKRKKKQ